MKNNGRHSIFEISSTTRWKIAGYGNERRAIFEEEYRKQEVIVRAEFRAVVNGLRDQPIEGWMRPAGFDRLTGKFRELGKLRFKVAKVQYRPLGFFGPKVGEFTFLIWATERDGKFNPPDVRETALERMKQILSGMAVTHEFDL